MKHHIDPKVDCVFKALLGREENASLLINFLNAFLGADLKKPITWVEILNPYLEQEFIGDKFSIVDVKARDSDEQLFQIEIQLLIKPWLSERIVYNWAKLMGQQLIEGDHYGVVRPTYSIWLLSSNLIADTSVVHRYQLRDENGESLNNHGGICLLELKKFDLETPINADDQRWLKFFIEGEKLDDTHLPNWMQTPEMRQAMNTLRIFSEKEREYFRYMSRMDSLCEQRSTENWVKQAGDNLQRATQELDLTTQKLDLAKQELEQVKQEADLAKQEADLAKQEADLAKQEADLVKQEAQKQMALRETAARDLDETKQKLEEVEHLRVFAEQREAQLRAELDRLQRGAA